jgi:hypothetical protein
MFKQEQALTGNGGVSMPHRFGAWDLEFVWNLGFGIWDFLLPARTNSDILREELP